MGAPRRFDHAEALRRRAAGESRKSVAAAMGVTTMSIYRIESPATEAREKRARDRYYAARRVPCEGGCGALVLGPDVSGRMEHNPDGRMLCRQCRSVEKRERFRFDTEGVLVSVRCHHLDCANGERWQSPDQFTGGTRYRDVRENGIHSVCRSCQTRARREWRHNHPDRQRAYDRQYKAARRVA